MITQSILNETLRSFDYYKNKLPIYLQNSYGFLEHFRIWYDLLVSDNNKGVVGNADIFLNLLQIFDENYLQYLKDNIEDYDDNESDILDKIGAIFGVTRHFEVTYADASKEQLNLNNREFLILIRGQIIKNYCDGSMEQMDYYYKTLGLDMFVQTSGTPATAYLYLATTPGYEYSDNMNKMFLGGMLKIQSAGIRYIETFIDLARLLIWDSTNWSTNDVDGGQWTI